MFLFIGLASCITVTLSEEKQFVSWMRQNSAIYLGDEYYLRLGIFLTNSRLVQEHNRNNKDFRVSLNKFATLTPSEYRTLLGRKRYNQKSETKYVSGARHDIPKSIDWREKGVVGQIRDQSFCGSCYAFGAIQAIESQWGIHHGEFIDLSQSNIVDCATTCYGCDGGQESDAYDYIIEKQKGLFMKYDDYPYQPYHKKCAFDENKCPGVKIISYIHFQSGNETMIGEAIATEGPLTCGLDAGEWSFPLYSDGIYYEPRCSSKMESLNHAVGLVGYGVADSQSGETPYWIIKNSWGTEWGEQGYMRLRKDFDNNCGVCTDNLLPYVAE